MKTCSKCKNEYPLDAFPFLAESKDGYHRWCFDCKRSYDREHGAKYRKNHPDKVKATQRAYNQSKAKLSANRRWRFGLEPEAIDLMIEAQGGVCGLCERDFSGGETFVDHDHTCCPPKKKTCGKCIRSILCRACNQGLGLLQDDPAFLRKAADYVEQHRDVR